MTDFEKVKHYYSHFDEKNRLRNDNSGKLEYLMTMQILEKYLPAVNAGEKVGADAGARENISILDLGGGAGGDDHVAAVGCQSAGHAEAQTLGAAGDDGGFAGQVKGGDADFTVEMSHWKTHS